MLCKTQFGVGVQITPDRLDGGPQFEHAWCEHKGEPDSGQAPLHGPGSEIPGMAQGAACDRKDGIGLIGKD